MIEALHILAVEVYTTLSVISTFFALNHRFESDETKLLRRPGEIGLQVVGSVLVKSVLLLPLIIPSYKICVLFTHWLTTPPE